MLFNEPKLLKSRQRGRPIAASVRFSALQRAEIAEIVPILALPREIVKRFSALQRAEIAEMRCAGARRPERSRVSVLFNEPKLLKSFAKPSASSSTLSFSALQRAEIAEIDPIARKPPSPRCFSALQRAEIAEMMIVSRR